MAPKSKAKGKAKSKDVADEDVTSPKLKAANSINVRHILVQSPVARQLSDLRTNVEMQCEKHSKKEEALAKLQEGVKFDEVARDFSEDKARQGRPEHWC